MVKCSNECPRHKDKGNTCCNYCELNNNCIDACEINNSECDNVMDEDKVLSVFQTNQASVIKSMTSICEAKKKLEEQEKKLKEELKTAMEKYGIKSFKNDVLKITYIGATTAVSVDSKKLKAEQLEIYNKYTKTSNKSAYVKVELE